MPTVSPSIIEQISTAMSVRTLQHSVIASNIANRDTQGYQRLKVRFEEAMDRPDAVRFVADSADAPVSLEQDLVALSANAAHYEAMARALNRYVLMINAIASDSRG